MRLLMIQHVECEGPGLLEAPLLASGWELDLRCMDRPGQTLPLDLNGYQACIILGGPMSAYEEDKYPYLNQVLGLVRAALEGRVPTLGICLGAQLIARALGAAVFPNQVKEIGWSHVNLTVAGRQDPLFAALPERLPVFQWHSDTFELPPGSVLLAGGDLCPHQAFVAGGCLWGVQFHLEVSLVMIAKWADLYQEELMDYAGPGAASVLARNSAPWWNGTAVSRERFLANVASILGRR